MHGNTACGWTPASCSEDMLCDLQPPNIPEDEDECADPNGCNEGETGANIGSICRNPRPTSPQLIGDPMTGHKHI